MSVRVYLNANEVAARHVKSKAAVRTARDRVTLKARHNLEMANSSTRVTDKGYFPATITESDGDIDAYTHLNAPNAMALEFGHAQSGYFDPDGPYLPGNNSRPPAAEYILTRAALCGFGGVIG